VFSNGLAFLKIVLKFGSDQMKGVDRVGNVVLVAHVVVVQVVVDVVHVVVDQSFRLAVVLVICGTCSSHFRFKEIFNRIEKIVLKVTRYLISNLA